MTGVLFLAVVGNVPAAELELASGAGRVALVELFTSQGCSSCPRADRWLSGLATRPDLWSGFVPVAWHVDYWDYLGWIDRFAQPGFSARQRAYRHAGGLTQVYTPGFVVNGREWRGWFRSRPLDPGVNDPPGDLSLRLSGDRVKVRFEPTSGQVHERLEAHVVVLGFGYRTPVAAGENRDRHLEEDFVVLGHAQAPLDNGDGPPVARLALPGFDPQGARRLALGAWVAPAGRPEPIQAAGGWLPETGP